jgi:tetratricopeptide (TPR) repeat protein
MRKQIFAESVIVLSLAVLIGFAACPAFAQDTKSNDPNQLFYTGNHYYQTQDYIKAVEEYVKLLDTGIENGNLYYNIGNGFLKLGKVGYAILCYEKARRLMPNDSDLKANLAYARSLIDEAASEDTHKNIIVRLVRKAYSDLSLSSIAELTLTLYLVLVLILALFIFNPIVGRKFGFIAVLLGLALGFNALAFGIRYYGEVVLKHGVIVQRTADAKYEPIDKSTTFYTLREGNGVIVLSTKEGWRQIRRFDGKTGWIKKEAAEEI